MPTEEDIAAQKAQEDADAKVKADADAKAKADADAASKVKADEQAAAALKASAGDATEAQWKAYETSSGLTRQQIQSAWVIAQTAQMNGPAGRVMEKDAWGEATKGVADVSFYEEDARKAVAALTPQERQDPKRVRKEIMAVRGEKIGAAGANGGTRRMGSGFETGGTTDAGGGTTEGERPDWSGLSKEDQHDREEVFRKFGFSDKKDWAAHDTRDLHILSDDNFKPKFR